MRSPHKLICPVVFALAGLACSGTVGAQIVAHDAHQARDVYILGLGNADKIAVGETIEVLLGDTNEIMIGEIVSVSRIGHDLELEILDVTHNTHIIIQFPEDSDNNQKHPRW